MRLLRFGFMVALVGTVTVGAWAYTEVEKGCDVAPSGGVLIKNIAGSINVQAWDRDRVEVKARLGAGVKRLDFNCTPRRTDIEVVVPRWSRRHIESHLQVFVPRMKDIEVNAVSADVRVENVAGTLKLQAVSGDVTVGGGAEWIKAKAVSGDVTLNGDAKYFDVRATSGDVTIAGNADELDVETASGDIELDGSFGAAKIQAISGDVEIAGAVSDLIVESVSGDISAARVLNTATAESVSGEVHLTGNRLTDGDLATISGRIECDTGLAEQADLEIESVSGTVALSLPQDLAATFSISSFSGSIRNDFGPQAQRVDKYGPGSELEFTLGDGTAQVDVETHSGSIRIQSK